ncbi:MAG TPA: S9 family peptidase [Roseiflexaceae bacterium]|nr:S9 family peptidase [Roseiflexaceae bacterium]
MPTPPRAPRRPHTLSAHGHTRTDDYYWLRERENPEVIAYLEAENRYADEFTARTAELREHLFQELVARVKEADESAPVRIGAHLYATRTEPQRQYAVHCRRPAPGAPEEVLLDENALAAGTPFFDLGTLRVSPDERLLAYTTATTGGEVYDLYVKDIATGALVDGPLHGVGEVEWAADSRTLCYTTYTESWRSYRAFRHTLGQEQAADALVYEEQDPTLYLHIKRCRSAAFLLLESTNAQSASAQLLPLDRPDEPPRPVTPRQAGVNYWAQHRGDELFILTNDRGPGYRVVVAPLADPDPARWREVAAGRDGVSIDGIDLFAGFLALYERVNGLVRLRVVDLAGGGEHTAAFAEPVYSLTWESRLPWPLNPTFDTRTLRLSYSSPVTPPQVLEYDTDSRSFRVVKQEEVPGYDAGLYTAERLWATAPDGVQVPISLVRRRDAPPGEPRPCLLSGYGAYGSISEPAFNARWLPLLERGFTCAIAHVRGGGELGEEWYRQGRVLTKRNTFTDFIACAEHLIAQGYTTPRQLAIRGRSAGGLLIGAVVMMRPELFGAAIAEVPFVDVVTTQSDPGIPLVEQEYEEWGDPRVREQYEYMRSYSPYDNVQQRDYPAILATAGLHDPRVQYWEPAKWVAKLRANRTDDRPLLLRTEMAGGHRGPSGRYDHLRETAFQWAFVLDALGLAN